MLGYLPVQTTGMQTVSAIKCQGFSRADVSVAKPLRSHGAVHSQAHLNKVARQLNERPRETLQSETPAERFNARVASTG
jgi:hypothetical protein